MSRSSSIGGRLVADPITKPRFVSHFPDGTVRVYDIYGDELPQYSGLLYEQVQEKIEQSAGKIGIAHRVIKDSEP